MVAPVVPEPALAQVAGTGFSISNQVLLLDVCLATRRLLGGKTEITVIPESEDLKAIQLNCKQCNISRVLVNNKEPSLWTHHRPWKGNKLHGQVSVNQYTLLEEKCNAAEDLVIHLPKTVKLEPTDVTSAEGQNAVLSRSVSTAKKLGVENAAIDPSQPIKTPADQALRFKPLIVVVEWSIDEVRDGLNFVGWEEGDLQYLHAYTTGKSQYLFPCVDTADARSTWDVRIRCPATLSDLYKAVPYQRPEDDDSENHDLCIVAIGEDKPVDSFGSSSGDDAERNPTGEKLQFNNFHDSLDKAKRVSRFVLESPVAACHVAFAIGPFESVNLAAFRELDEEERLGQSAIPLDGYCLPGRIEHLKNTCLPLAKAMDYFGLTYGSYPFSSYKICFVDNQVSDCADGASLTICSNRLLFPAEVIEPMDSVTRKLAHALASQWIGVNIIPQQLEDTWAVVGMAYFITDQFMRKLAGNNEYRYQQKRAADRTVQADVARPSLYELGALTDIDPSQIEFMALKAPLVLFILDRRLAKASGSTGLSRIVSRVFLNARVGELPNGAINTANFIKTCEKLGHAKLDTFFLQWVYGAGCPKFRVSQRFNKKKLVVEMTIHQTQADPTPERDLDRTTFMRDVKEEEENVFAGPIQPAFTGPMTIRIHEADGTPYEHIVEIKDVATKFEIPYNTKYKRLKRSRRQKERTNVATGLEYAADAQDDVLLYSLGDVLQSEEEIRAWRLTEWSKEDEERMSQESYEWIRMDADFEWISKIVINMPGYMYLSQLQQDRDVVAQLESVQYLAYQNANPLISTILVRTLVDSRYFHGIRTAAAAALAKNAKAEIGWAGLHHLQRAFEEFFCLPDSKMVSSNDFSNRASYYVQCAIPMAIGQIRDSTGKSPFAARSFLYEKIRYNDNSSNEYSDSHYLAVLMNSLAKAIAANPPLDSDNMELGDDGGDNLQFHESCLEEIDRYRRLDQWIPSFHNILTTTALDCRARLMKADIVPTNAAEFLQYTRDGCFGGLRVRAFTHLVDLGLVRKLPIMKWFIFALSSDTSPYMRSNLVSLFGQLLGSIAIGEDQASASQAHVQAGGLIVEQESSTDARQADLARKKTIQGAIQALRREFGQHQAFKDVFWQAVQSPVLSVDEVYELLHICSMLYDPIKSQLVIMYYKRYWRIYNHGKRVIPAKEGDGSHKETTSHELTFKRDGRVKTKRDPPRWVPKIKGTPTLKRQRSDSVELPSRPLLKGPKKLKRCTDGAKKPGHTPQAENRVALGEEIPRPKLTLKLKLGPKRA